MNLVATRWWSMLFMPSCVLMMGIALGVFLMLRAWRRGKRPGEARFACWLTAASVMMLYLASTPLVARWAAWTLEKDYPPVDVKTLPVADAIVVLGGAMYATEGLDGVVHLYAHHAGDRFETGLAAFETGRAPLIVFGGGIVLLFIAAESWRARGFGAMDYRETLRLVIPGMTLSVLGFQTILSGFFITILGMRRR
jgi:uncharacterized SAM-binding protein YcdF (DUF218 family)